MFLALADSSRIFGSCSLPLAPRSHAFRIERTRGFESMTRFSRRILLPTLLLVLAGCAKSSSDPASCPALTGTPWTPQIAGTGSANHDPSIAIARTVLSTQGPVIGLTQPAPATVEVPVTIDM